MCETYEVPENSNRWLTEIKQKYGNAAEKN
jgi:hypothetical protein